MNIEHLCKGCMRQMDTPDGICPRCGYDNGKPENRSIKCLPEYTILNGRYMIGRVLGEGGFGITYLALDLISETPVAVKEYFPAGLAARDPVDGGGETLIMLDGERERYFQDGLKKFALEGRNLAKLSRQPGIVTALDFFEANGTAYLVMEYIEGQSLKQYMQWYRKNSNNKSIDYPVAIAFLEPVMKALIEVHRAGLIHRDISPDNILVDKDGKVTLIDFGAARVGVKENELRSMTIMVKHGYAPQEQYRTHGKQGPWTDVYALCATLYHMISGELPVDSVERMDNDELIPLKNLDLPVPVPAVISDILEKGMKVRPTERYQTMEELYQDLKKAQEELDAREKVLEKERLEQARLEAERLERERLEAARLEAEQLEQERQQMEQESLSKTQTQTGNIQTVAGRSTETVAINGTEKITPNYAGIYSDDENGGKLPDVHEMLEKFQRQEEALKEKENALKKQEEALKEQERLRLEEQKSRQKKMLYGIAALAAVAVIAGACVGISHIKSDKQEEPLPATTQVQATEKERITEINHPTEIEGITETETEIIAVTEESTTEESFTGKKNLSASNCTIGILQFAEHDLLNDCREGFLEGLAAEGFSEGENLTVIYENAQADIASASTISDGFVSDSVDLICALATQSAVSAYSSCTGTDIPVVYTAVSDPVAAGLAKEEETPVENVTGTIDAITPKMQLNTIQKILPDTKSVCLFYTTSATPDINSSIERYIAAAEECGLEIVYTGYNDISVPMDDIENLLTATCGIMADCILLADDCLDVETYGLIVSANNGKVPVFGNNVDQVGAGCLAYVGIDYTELGKQTGKMAASILKGETTASETNYEYCENINLYWNTDTAEKLGITINEDNFSTVTTVVSGN